MDKKVVTLQDISCFGKCSLTVALPVISAMGISCSIIPTAVLSTHTGGFTGYTFRDLTEDIQKISDHWKTCGITFDGIYTGYLGSCHQVDVVSDFIAQNRREGALVFIDPAMADNGVLYSGFDSAFVDSMRELCREADIVVPNITEASMLLNTEYKQSGYDEEYIRGMLRRGIKSRPVWRVESLNNEKPDNEKGKDYDVVGLVRTGKHRVCGARR